ncbi:MAG: sugar transporter [Candidatus Binatia bacterium]|nr:MAG: sugar transporter [Candidatus Binatia bacterium]
MTTTTTPERQLLPHQKALYATGDFTINAALNALAFVFTAYFLVHVAELRPALAGLVPMIGRAVDAFTDPLMGRISDQTRWRWGRRRPYFLLGALPFGLSFALLWTPAPFSQEGWRFAYYTVLYCCLTTAMTVLAIPYLALQPEMATSYDDRTALNTYRSAGAILGVFAAISIRPLAQLLGGGPEGFQRVGMILGLMFALPWFVVYRVSFERPEFRSRAETTSFFRGLVEVLGHPNFRRLLAVFLFSRLATDVISTLLILYFTHWLGRSYDFERGMTIFLVAVVLALPLWLAVARRTEKTTLFALGASIWAAVQLLLLFVEPEWPRGLLFVLMLVAGCGYAAVDVMPWSMLGEVIDEDELRTGQRREGLYNGVFTFVRKLAGATGVFLVLALLDLIGFHGNAAATDSPRQAIRWLAGLAPLLFLSLGIFAASRYPLTRTRHREILAQLWKRRAASGARTPPDRRARST